ncbi:hypothetical protein BDM02DRAFT_3150104 [Thelephora ganbajun]|uniref:Uncharacterized protein n=1 Tax=Thelephora ganbajun TaxID=370292 RepID=A0ACB6Z4P0_THEGA|nr:hypothetical protein BDM02DRAFT_3150104 [Thelephora ganbajun]
MSEYWVSNKKYYCTYCKIYIADDAPSRQQHENGLRHKGNKERFVRGLYKTSEKRKHDLEEEKREMMRIDQAAQAAFAQDVGSGLVKPGSSSRSTTLSTPVQKPTATKPSKPSDPWANYSTAASLGYTDPEEERMNAEVERRRTQGVAGEWEVVEQSTSNKVDDEVEVDATSELSKKREAEGPPDSEDARSFRLRKRVAPLVTDDWSTDLIPIKLKPKMEEVLEPTEQVKTEEGSSQPTGVVPVKWTSRGWKRPEDEPDGTPSSLESNDEEVETKPVAVPEPVAAVLEVDTKVGPEVSPVKAEPPTETVDGIGVVFRKRKFGGNRGKR